MKIDKTEIVNFFKKIRMDKDEKIEEAKFNFDTNGLKVLATSNTKSTQVSALLKPAAFKEYEKIGVVAINDLTNVQGVFDRFKGVITIKKSGNCMIVNGDNKKVDIELVSEQFLVNEKEPQGLVFENEIIIDSTTLKEIVADIELNKEAELIVTTGDKVVKFSNTGKYKFETTLEAPLCKVGTVVKFGQAFIDATKNLNGMLKLHVGTNYPCKIVEESDISTISIIIAPRIADSE